MRALILIALLASPVLAKGPKHAFQDPKLNDELTNVYYDISTSKSLAATVVKSTVLTGSSINLDVAGTFVNITSISLSPGEWDITASLAFSLNTAVGLTATFGAISIYSGNTTTDQVVPENQFNAVNALPNSNGPAYMTIPSYRLLVASTTTVYLKAAASGSSGVPKAYGSISARRVR